VFMSTENIYDRAVRINSVTPERLEEIKKERERLMHISGKRSIGQKRELVMLDRELLGLKEMIWEEL
jgi:hypothetical protein